MNFASNPALNENDMMLTLATNTSVHNPYSTDPLTADLYFLDITMVNTTPSSTEEGTIINSEDIECHTEPFDDIDGADGYSGDLPLFCNDFQMVNAPRECISNLHGDRSQQITTELVEYELSLSTTHEANSLVQKRPSYSPDPLVSTNHIQASNSRDHTKSDKTRSTQECDYPGCHKAFLRREHLKRHKQTSHGEGPNKFSCEFCEKDSFNRQDNLNYHRKLHARPNSGNRGVEFIPAAVPIIEKEQRNKRRQKGFPRTIGVTSKFI